MNMDVKELIKEQTELKNHLKESAIDISIQDIIENLYSLTKCDLQYVKLKVRTNVKLPGKDPESIDELRKILKSDKSINPQIEVLLVSDYRKKHDNKIFKYLFKIPFTLDDKLSDGSTILDNVDMIYTYDDFLETSYLTLTFDEDKIPNLIYKVTKDNLNSYNQDLYTPYSLITKVFVNHLRKSKTAQKKTLK